MSKVPTVFAFENDRKFRSDIKVKDMARLLKYI